MKYGLELYEYFKEAIDKRYLKCKMYILRGQK